MSWLLVLNLALLSAIGVGCASVDPERTAARRTDFSVVNEDGLRLFVRRIQTGSESKDRGPFLLVNGPRSGVLASWDVGADGASTAELLAGAGHTVYLMDVRGFGRSEYPTAMHRRRFASPVAVRSYAAVRDIAAVVHEIQKRHRGDPRLAAMGWAVGSQWLGHFASLYPDQISHLVYYQGAYAGLDEPWPFQSIAAPGAPAELNHEEFGAYGCASESALTKRLLEEGANGRLVRRYTALAFEGDGRAYERNPPCFRFPTGPLADTLMMVNGRPLFDAAFIESKVLILRAENDFWSRATDARTLCEHLSSASSVLEIELPGASHYVHMLPGPSRRSFLSAVLGFTREPIRLRPGRGRSGNPTQPEGYGGQGGSPTISKPR